MPLGGCWVAAPAERLPVPIERIGRRIYSIRGEKVMLNSDLAELYQVPTFRFNEAVKRNRRRFPEDFMFQLAKDEAEALTSHFAMSKRGRGGRRTSPYAFTEHGVAMLSSVLNSERAVQMNITIIRAFVKLRQMLAGNKELAHRLEAVERDLKAHARAIAVVYDEVKKLQAPPSTPKRRIGFRTEPQ